MISKIRAEEVSDNPYTAPQSQLSHSALAPSLPFSSPYGSHYREVGRLRTVILILLGILCLISIFQIVTMVALNEALTSGRQNEDFQNVSKQLSLNYRNLRTIHLFVFIANIVIWCIWKNKSCKNVWLFRATNPNTPTSSQSAPTSAWAVGSYFVPILNLWKPFQAMAFIRDQLSTRVHTGPLLGLWWSGWLTMSIGGNLSGNYLKLLGIERRVFTTINGQIIESIVSIISAIFAALVIHKLTVGQSLVARDLGLIPECKDPIPSRRESGLRKSSGFPTLR